MLLKFTECYLLKFVVNHFLISKQPSSVIVLIIYLYNNITKICIYLLVIIKISFNQRDKLNNLGRL